MIDLILNGLKEIALPGIAAIALLCVGYIAGYDARGREIVESEFEWADEVVVEIRNLPEAVAR